MKKLGAQRNLPRGEMVEKPTWSSTTVAHRPQQRECEETVETWSCHSVFRCHFCSRPFMMCSGLQVSTNRLIRLHVRTITRQDGHHRESFRGCGEAILSFSLSRCPSLCVCAVHPCQSRTLVESSTGFLEADNKSLGLVLRTVSEHCT